jgi:DNA-binding transcriptional MerR regulator
MTANEDLFPWESEAEAAARLREDAHAENEADGTDGPVASETADADGEASSAPATPAPGGGTPGHGTASVEPELTDAQDAAGGATVRDPDLEDAAFEAARARAELDFEPRPGSTAAPGPRERRIAPREYYSISEVCEITGLKPHVLRYWEAQFPLLNPSKNRSGNRVYQRKEIRLILLVKELLYEEKYTVEGAKAKLEQIRGGGEQARATSHALDRHMIQLLRSELRQLAELLTPPRS